MKILFVGDVIGRPGRRLLLRRLEKIVADLRIDICVINCENAAAGFGVTPSIADELFNRGAHVLTSGNHIWDKRDIYDYLEMRPNLLRPANYPDGVPGTGIYVGTAAAGTKYAVLNLQGRVYMPAIDCPFRKVDELLESISPQVAVRLVDFHADATSEKMAFGAYLDGRVTAVVGTHTHVPTADARVLPGGTAYISDVGMTGSYDSVIGMEKDGSIKRFLSGLPGRFEPATRDVRISAVLIEADESTGLAISIERFEEGDEASAASAGR